MKKRSISLFVALVLVLQGLISIPVLAGVLDTVKPEDVYLNGSDFSEFATGGAEDGLPISLGTTWIVKGSAAVRGETLMQDTDGTKYANIKSDSVKAGKPGEGSYYFYHSSKTSMDDQGYMQFDIRMNSGVINFQLGSFDDPTKGTSPSGVEMKFDSNAGKIIAYSTGGIAQDVIKDLAKGTWYTVKIDVNVQLQEYTVTVLDKKGSVLGAAKEVPFVNVNCTKITTQCFSYVRKLNGHDFDLTNVTIARVAGKLVPPKGSTPTVAPTVVPTAAPSDEPAVTPTVVPMEDSASEFSDINTHWAKMYIVKMSKAKIINGMDSKTFAPDKQITRGQFIKLIVATLGLNTKVDNKGKAKDINGHWSGSYIKAAEIAGLIDSSFYNDDAISPDANITREEMASLVTRAAKLKGIDITGGSVDSFTDKASIDTWASGDVGGAVKLGIVTGMGDGSFAPKAEATRAQAAVMMSRLLEQIKQ